MSACSPPAPPPPPPPPKPAACLASSALSDVTLGAALRWSGAQPKIELLRVEGKTGEDGAATSMTLDGLTIALPTAAPETAAKDATGAAVDGAQEAAETTSPTAGGADGTGGGASETEAGAGSSGKASADATSDPAGETAVDAADAGKSPQPSAQDDADAKDAKTEGQAAAPPPPTVKPLPDVGAASGIVDGFYLTIPGKDGSAQAFATLGAVTPGAEMPAAGKTLLEGAVRIWEWDRSGKTSAEPVTLVGRASFAAGYSTGRIDITFDMLDVAPAVADDAPTETDDADLVEKGAPPPPSAPARLPPQRIEWAGLAICGVEIGSDGVGELRAFDAERNPIDLVGASKAGPGGAAALSAFFHGFDAKLGAPAAAAGVFSLQGDTGVVIGVFSVGAPSAPEENPSPDATAEAADAANDAASTPKP